MRSNLYTHRVSAGNQKIIHHYLPVHQNDNEEDWDRVVRNVKSKMIDICYKEIK